MLLHRRDPATDTAVLEAQAPISADFGSTRASQPDQQRTWRRWALPAAALVIGIGLGGVAGGPDPTQSEEYRVVQAELAAAEDDVEAAAGRAATAEAATRQAQAEQTRLAAEVTALRATAQAAKAAPLPAAAVPAPATAAAAKPAPAAVAPAAKPAPEPAPSAAPPVEESEPDVYYANCSAARAAGAAPIHSGEPGYGTHLDRDRDGTGCDS